MNIIFAHLSPRRDKRHRQTYIETDAGKHAHTDTLADLCTNCFRATWPAAPAILTQEAVLLLRFRSSLSLLGDSDRPFSFFSSS